MSTNSSKKRYPVRLFFAISNAAQSLEDEVNSAESVVPSETRGEHQTASDHQFTVSRKDWRLSLRFVSEDRTKPPPLFHNALALVANKWSSNHSVFNLDNGSDGIIERSKAAIENVEVNILSSEDECATLRENNLRPSVYELFSELQLPCLVGILPAITNRHRRVRLVREIDIDLLMSVIVLREGETSQWQRDYLEVLGAWDAELHSTPESLPDCFQTPLPEDVCARFWPGEPLSNLESRESESPTLLAAYNGFRKQTVHALGHQCFGFGKQHFVRGLSSGYWWRNQNGFVAEYIGMQKEGLDIAIGTWNTVVYSAVVGPAEQPSPNRSLQPILFDYDNIMFIERNQTIPIHKRLNAFAEFT